MIELRISRAAQADVLEIWSYVAEQNAERADRHIDEITAQYDVLLDFPRMGRSREELRPGLRSFPVGRYILYYRILPME